MISVYGIPHFFNYMTDLDFAALFRKGKFHVIPQFNKNDIDISSHSGEARERKCNCIAQ